MFALVHGAEHVDLTVDAVAYGANSTSCGTALAGLLLASKNPVCLGSHAQGICIDALISLSIMALRTGVICLQAGKLLRPRFNAIHFPVLAIQLFTCTTGRLSRGIGKKQ